MEPVRIPSCVPDEVEKRLASRRPAVRRPRFCFRSLLVAIAVIALALGVRGWIAEVGRRELAFRAAAERAILVRFPGFAFQSARRSGVNDHPTWRFSGWDGHGRYWLLDVSDAGGFIWDEHEMAGDR